MKIQKNEDGSRTLIPEKDESDILDYIDRTLGSSFISRKIQELVDQRRQQRDYDETIELNANLNTLPREEKIKIIESTVIQIVDKSQELAIKDVGLESSLTK